MAVSLEDLIDINLLKYYNDKIQAWTMEAIGEQTTGLEIRPEADLPAEGEIGRVYITENAIVTWDSSTQSYVAMGGSADSSSSRWVEM